MCTFMDECGTCWCGLNWRGRSPVASVYNVPVLLYASAAKHKLLLNWPSEDPSSHGMLVGIISLLLGTLCPKGAQWGLGALALVLRITVRGRFILTFELAGDICRYFCTLSDVMKGHPLGW